MRISVSDAVRYMGAGEGNGETRAMTAEIAAELERTIQPRYAWRAFRVRQAEDGVRLAIVRMNADATVAAKANGATGKMESLLTVKAGDASVEVFARKKGTEILLLGLGKNEEEHARAIGVVKENAGKYSIEHWER